MAYITRRMFLKSTGIVILSTAATAGGIYLYSEHIEPQWIDVSSTTLHLPHLQPAFAGYRVLQLSDIHVDQVWMDKKRLEEIVALANAQEPDLILITGDYVTYVRNYTEGVLSALQGLRAHDGVFGVLGNHDHWSNPAAVRQYIARFGVTELNNQTTTIRRGDASLHLLGMDDLLPTWRAPAPDIWSFRGDLMSLVGQLPEEGAAILLIHEPAFANVAASVGRIDLQLSGHSHGGQVRVPLIGAPYLPALVGKYVSGLHTVGTMYQYTNRGLGMVPPRYRFDCRPEISVFTLLPTSASTS